MSPTAAPRGPTPYLSFLLLSVSIGSLLFGFHLAELNAPQDVITCKRDSIRASLERLDGTESTPLLPHCIPMTALELGIVTSTLTLGGFLGSVFAGSYSTRVGLVRALITATLFAIAGPFFEATSFGIVSISIGRFLSGVGAGAAIVVGPIYIAELVHKDAKGMYGSITQVMINCGIFIAQLLGYFLSHGQMWRLILLVPCGIAVLNVVTLSFTTESPKRLAASGASDRAAVTRLMKRIRGLKCDVEEEIDKWKFGATSGLRNGDSEASSDQPLSSTSSGSDDHSQDHASIGMLEALLSPQIRPATIAVVAVMVAQQFTGINSIIMYGVSLLSSLLESSSAMLNLFVSLLNIAVTLSCASLSDRLGRKTCILYSIAGMGTSSFLLAISIINSFKILSVIAVIAFVGSFAVGLGPVPFILASELVDSNAVGAIQSWALAANSIATFVVAQFFPVVNELLGEGQIYFVFASLAVFFFAFIYSRVPETKDKHSFAEVWEGYFAYAAVPSRAD